MNQGNNSEPMCKQNQSYFFWKRKANTEEHVYKIVLEIVRSEV